MAYRDLPHDDYNAGFDAAYMAIKGTDELPRVRTAQPRLKRVGMTWFLEGIFAGVEAAGIDLEDFR